MPSNVSHHLLPMNSILFSSNTNNARTSHAPVPAYPSIPTLANLKDAQNTSITALPQPPGTNTGDTVAKDPVWKRFLTAVGVWFCCGREGRKMVEEGEVGNVEKDVDGDGTGKGTVISEPRGFRHVGSARPIGLGGGTRGLDQVRESESESESEWEDLEQENGLERGWDITFPGTTRK